MRGRGIKKIRCGRIILTKDGEIKKIGLGKGGGPRVYEWRYYNISFDCVRSELIKIFNIRDTEYQFSLYDFQLRPLDVGQYKSLGQYMKNNGLTGNSTVLYLCNREVDDDQKSRKMIIKKKNNKKDSTKTSISSTSEQEISTEIKSISSTALIEYQSVVKSEPVYEPQQIPSSLLEYSFKNTSNDLVKHVRDLINQNSFNEILIQIFEYFCIIYGYICSTIDPVQQNQYFQSEHLQSLDNVNHICESIETLFNLNKDKFDQIQNFSTINDLFIQFYQNIKILRNQWFDHIENKNKFNGTSSHRNIQPLNEDQNELNVKIPTKQTYELFQPLLNYATDLLEIMNTSRLSTFRTMIKYLITDLEFARSNVDLYNYQSLCNCKQAITSIKIRYTRKFDEHSLKSSDYQFTREIKQVHQKTLREICSLITSLQQYQLKTDEQEKSFSINHQQQSEANQFIPSNKRKTFHQNNAQMDIATYSSSSKTEKIKSR